MQARDLLSNEQINDIKEVVEIVSFEIAERAYINNEHNLARFKQNLHPYILLLIPLAVASLTSDLPREYIASSAALLFMIYFMYHYQFVYTPIDYLSNTSKEKVNGLISELQGLEILTNINKDTSIQSLLTELRKIVPEAKDHPLLKTVSHMSDRLLNRFQDEYQKLVGFRELGFFSEYRHAIEAKALSGGKTRQRARSILLDHMEREDKTTTNQVAARTRWTER